MKVLPKNMNISLHKVKTFGWNQDSQTWINSYMLNKTKYFYFLIHKDNVECRLLFIYIKSNYCPWTVCFQHYKFYGSIIFLFVLGTKTSSKKFYLNHNRFLYDWKGSLLSMIRSVFKWFNTNAYHIQNSIFNISYFHYCKINTK